MRARNYCTSFFQRGCKKVTNTLLYYTTSLGKYINSGGQVVFGDDGFFNYVEALIKGIVPAKGSVPYQNPSTVSLVVSSICLACNLVITRYTRIPALRRLFLNPTPSHQEGFLYTDFTSEHGRVYLGFFILAGFTAFFNGLFTMSSAWLFGEKMGDFCFQIFGIQPDNPDWDETTNTVKIGTSTYQVCCTGPTNYAYNAQKIFKGYKRAAEKYINKDYVWGNLTRVEKIRVLETSLFSFFNTLNSANFAYYSTKKSMPRLAATLAGSIMAPEVVTTISIISLLTTISTSLVTVTPAFYNSLSKSYTSSNHPLEQNRRAKCRRFTVLQFCGSVDSLSNALGNFVGASELLHDLSNDAFPHGSLQLNILSAFFSLIGLIANKVFNVNQGFEDCTWDDINRIVAEWTLARTIRRQPLPLPDRRADPEIPESKTQVPLTQQPIDKSEAVRVQKKKNPSRQIMPASFSPTDFSSTLFPSPPPRRPPRSITPPSPPSRPLGNSQLVRAPLSPSRSPK